MGLVCLIALPVPFLRSIGYAGALIAFVALALEINLLPVTLAWFGPALDRYALWRPADPI